ncbi:MAG TPA: transglutaminase-like domain-containing protein, partial [Bacteroidales bacterium]|nr:transglutaminase-like domain-containing protein [Bacteroidales bacterium]
MKAKYLLIPAVIETCFSCSSQQNSGNPFQKIANDISAGRISRALIMTDSLKKVYQPGSNEWMRADSLQQISERIKIDYKLTRTELKERIAQITGRPDSTEFLLWEKKGFPDYRIIDGEKQYFKRSPGNLILLADFYNKTGNKTNEKSAFRLNHTAKVLEQPAGLPSVPVQIKFQYTITVDADALPAGEKIRCWMPFPRSDQNRQKDVRLLETSEKNYIMSPDSAVHSSIYMEKAAKAGEKTVFSISCSYTSYALHFDTITFSGYNKDSNLYRTYTAEQQPHINFSPEIRKLADSITGNETNPVLVVRKMWYWLKMNVPWTGAPEYSIIPDISGFTLKQKTGDCGMQTFLFMSLLRYKGIPVRWQSGWMMPPFEVNLHDWCEVYFEGTGWVPADPSYDLQTTGNKKLSEYFLSGIDSYRMIINTGVSGQ